MSLLLEGFEPAIPMFKRLKIEFQSMNTLQ
jgi:hypothetical protein